MAAFRHKAFFGFLLLLTLAAGLCGVADAQAEEKILDFESVITVNHDASLDVSEKITVQAEGKEIVHGIYRDIPIKRPTPSGGKDTLRIEVKNVLRDGRAIRFKEEYLDYDFRRIYLGDKKTSIPPGTYAYELRYHVTNALGRLADHDELYWNVTGNGWLFPIERVAAEVRLPWGALATQHSAYTGYRGSKKQDFTTEEFNGGNALRFETTRPFEEGEGLTFAVGWPKGIIDPPPQYAPNEETWTIWAGGGIALLAWYLASLFTQRRRPLYRSPPVIPAEITELSPAEMYYALHKKLDRWGKNRIFSAMLLTLAAKGALTITRKKRAQYILERSETEPEGLTEDEQRTLKLMFLETNKLTLGERDDTHIKDFKSLKQGFRELFRRPIGESDRWVVAYWALFKQLENKWERVLFDKARFILGVGIVLTVATVTLAAFLTPQELGDMTFVYAGLAGLTVLTVWMIEKSIKLWRRVIAGARVYWREALFYGVMSCIFIACLSVFWIAGRDEFHWPTLAFCLILITANLLFYRLLTAYTATGKALKRRIEDFRSSLVKEARDAPYDPERFARRYPYAIALGIEKYWDRKLATALTLSGVENYPPTYFPVWLLYAGAGYGSFTAGLTSTISVTTISMGGTGSGLGGGGFSGGGVGGGGGGGF